ncbi:MAG: class I SAM-dependent methyltransferase [Chlamydiales bacterium]
MTDLSMEQIWELANNFNVYDKKFLLSFIREGDYAHAGEEEAIELVMSHFPKDGNRKILDVACGLGGTAHYIQKHGWGLVTGFDIDNESIQYATSKYPCEIFFVADVSNISNRIESPDFDLIYIMNAFYCFTDQLQCLKELRKLAKPSTKLVIFEYTDLKEKNNSLSDRKEDVYFKPIRPSEIDILVSEADWETIMYIPLNSTFKNWYKNFLDRVDLKRHLIEERFGKNTTTCILEKYNPLYYRLKNKSLGGCLIILSPKGRSSHSKMNQL